MARRSSLPPGFRFHPTDVELVMYYLKRKILGKKLCFEAISEVKIYNFSPWDLPDKSCWRSKDREWFFFCPIERKYPNGARAKRATETGYWKATGKDRNVLYDEKIVGMVRTLVFYTGHAPKGNRTDWVMHEYRMEDKVMTDAAAGVQDAYVLCKVFEKSGPGPKNGAQYGAPFIEEDWSEDDDEETTREGESVDELAPPPVLPLPPNFQKSCSVTSMIVPGHANSSSLSEPGLGLSTAGPSVTEVPDEGEGDIASLLDMFTEVGTLLPMLNDNNEKLRHNNCDKKNMERGDNIFDGLGNLSEGGGGYKFSSIGEAFLELNDLNTPLEHHPPIDEEASGSQLLLSTDTSTLSYNCHHVNLDHLYHGGGTLSDSVQNLSCYNQSLDPQSNYPGNQFHVLQKDIGSRDDENEGDISALYNMDFTSTHSVGGKDARFSTNPR